MTPGERDELDKMMCIVDDEEVPAPGWMLSPWFIGTLAALFILAFLPY